MEKVEKKILLYVAKDGREFFDEDKCKDAEIDVAVQINGKFRGTVHVVAGLDNDSLAEAAKADEKIAKAIEKTGKSVFKTIVVPNKLVNFIVK